MWAFILVYFFGILVGVAASLLLNVQLRRPGLTKSIALVVLAVLLTVFTSTHPIGMPHWLLMSLWAGIGLLAGLGSQQVRGSI